MLEAILFCHSGRALETQVVGGQSCNRSAIVICRGLGNDGRAVEDAAENHLIMRDAAVHDFLSTVEKKLDVLYLTVSTMAIAGRYR